MKKINKLILTILKMETGKMHGSKLFINFVLVFYFFFYTFILVYYKLNLYQ